ncbi:MAG TPA: hypothetical protein VG603_01860, partial [Chitinophagales bacterium]|nr:hypothetical protein [Chitinophagales bacterium]
MKITRIFFVAVIAILGFSRCELLELGEGVGMGEAGAVAESAGVELTEIGVAEGTEGMLGRAIISDEPAFLRELEEVEVRGAVEGRPQLYVKNESSAFAEIEGRKYLRVFKTMKTYPVNNTIFAVEGENLMLRPAKSFSGNIVSVLNHGDLITELYEDNGWYKVRVAKAGQILEGFIPVNSASLALLVVGYNDKNKHTNATGTNGNIEVNYKKLINNGFLKAGDKTRVSVIIANANGEFSVPLSSGIANIYSQNGYLSDFSLFKYEFTNTPGFNEFFQGGTTWAKGINLKQY